MTELSSAPAFPRDKVLVIDDTPPNIELVRGILSLEGYEVLSATDGLSGIALFQQERPALVLLDILMPGLNGFETCERLRQLPEGLDVPIVFLTALSDLGSHNSAIGSGADDYLTKPIQRTELVLRVRSLLRVSHMSRALRDGNETIRRQHRALLEAQRQKERLSQFVVHDLKGPLSGILGNAEFLATAPGADPLFQELAGLVVTSALAMNRMVMNLLDISRSEEGKLSFKPKSISLGSICAEVLAAARHVAERQKIVLRMRDDHSKVRGDEDLLRRLIENLLDNACKYTPVEGGQVDVEVRALDESRVALSVRDQGPGVPEEYREGIFDRYVQAPESAMRASHGLGLAFCKLVSEALGGRIWVEDNEPKGSTFCVVLPRAP